MKNVHNKITQTTVSIMLPYNSHIFRGGGLIHHLTNMLQNAVVTTLTCIVTKHSECICLLFFFGLFVLVVVFVCLFRFVVTWL